MGVKSLWSLLAPAGRPVMLETVEGKSMAIDSSIWIYQFQATMRDKEGRGLVNAHVLGFLRRICKLLFYGIKPVFVFDGGAPALKRMTIAERKKKKSGAAESHVKIAEKLLAAQLRKEALNHAQSLKGSSKGLRIPEGPVTVDDDTVYLEDLDDATRTPAKNKGKAKETPTSSAQKSRWQDHDPYRLPEVDMDVAIAKATRSTAPDPRLATEEELRVFIEMMRPEDLDVHSDAFRELPTEVQYEIIGDLRLKSRQTSHKRLQEMLRRSRTALDFSRAQILNLKQRNDLTQQLLETTDSIGRANVTIPIRIAAERNREYVLIKNEDEVGGWVLGIRDDGTQDKPIVLDNADELIKSDVDSDEDMDMEEVSIPQTAAADPDLRDYKRGLALSGVKRRQEAAAARGVPKVSASRKKKLTKKEPLFIPDADEDITEADYETDSEWENAEDADMVTAMQASLEDREAEQLRKAIEESRKMESRKPSGRPSHGIVSSSEQRDLQAELSDDDLYVEYTPSRLDAALRFANTSHNIHVSPPVAISQSSRPQPTPQASQTFVVNDEDEDEDMEEVEVPFTSSFTIPSLHETERKELAQIDEPLTRRKSNDIDALTITPMDNTTKTISRNSTPSITSAEVISVPSTSVEDIVHEQIKQTNLPLLDARPPTILIHETPESSDFAGAATITPSRNTDVESRAADFHESELSSVSQSKDSEDFAEVDTVETLSRQDAAEIQNDSEASSSDDEAWSLPASPGGTKSLEDTTTPHEEGWDAAEEMNVHEETGEFARFAAQVRGRDLNTVRDEIDEEIRQLHQQRKAAMRDSEDVNQAMIAQIMTMLRLFGIPYITAPMEAEAQCATLVELGLVDGVITDDSDVFLFGAKRVFKNMFNQAKTVECFLLTDLARELGLDRGTLVRLAYLLGSDYTTGLPGVGPVVAMELLREFPGDDGLHQFKEWWSKVQSGRDKESDNTSAFRKRFKKRFKNLYLPSDWPNAAVRDAYCHPVVDTSEEPFKWGLPDLDGLRSFFHDELSWNAGKVDDLLLPIIQKMNKRGQEIAANRQGALNDFFAVSEGSGAAEPRRREAYASRRLQALVSAHRKAQKQRSEGAELLEGEEEEMPPAKKRRKKASPTESSKKVKSSNTGRRGKAKPDGEGPSENSMASAQPKHKASNKTKSKAKSKSALQTQPDSDSSDEFVPESGPSGAPVREISLRKRVRPRPAYKGAIDGENNNPEGAVDSVSEGSVHQG